jgi:hypothetical protein
MASQSLIPKKKRGPAPTGKGVPVMVRLLPQPLAALDDWRRLQGEIPTRPEAIRRLIEAGLKAEAGSKRRKSSDHQA